MVEIILWTAALGGERFLTEIRTTARLQHPHILPLLDSGELDGFLYYVMPPFRGYANFDVMPDGRLVLLRPMENSQRIVVAHGWFKGWESRNGHLVCR